MGKNGELWDESALVDAFDRAVATYKAMHGKKTQATTHEEEKSEQAVATTEQEDPIPAAATDERVEKDASYTNLPCVVTETPLQSSTERQTNKEAPLQETDPNKEMHVLESDATADGNKSSSQQTWEYNELLRQYYELEEQSRNVLQQLQQTNYWNYQAPEYAMHQQLQVPAYSGTTPDSHSFTTTASSCYWNFPMVSDSCCSASQSGGSSTSVPPNGVCSVSLTCDRCPTAGTTNPTAANFTQLPAKVPTNDDQVTKTAMMTAEAALNFMRSAISREHGSQSRESETGKESKSMSLNPNVGTTGVDGDLAVVLNAWYAAGFYTGRYLMQQSTKKSNQ